MEFIIYNKDMLKADLLAKNIVVTDDCDVAEGTKIWSCVCIKDKTVIGYGCEICSNSVLQNAVVDNDVEIKSSFWKIVKLGRVVKLVRLHIFVTMQPLIKIAG